MDQAQTRSVENCTSHQLNQHLMTQLNPTLPRLPGTWPGLLPSCASEVTTLLPRSSTSTCTPYIDRSTSNRLRKTRWCLVSNGRYALEDGFTDHPEEAIQLICLDVAIQRIIASGRLGLVPCPVTFELDGDNWEAVTQ